MNPAIYLDHHSTTPLDPRVLDGMMPYLTGQFGNAASRTHVHGQRALEAVEGARAAVALFLGAEPRDIIFTSGATESNNLALLGASEALRSRGTHIISCATEHHSVLDPLAALEKRGFEITRIPVSPDGLLDPDRVRAAVTPGTILLSFMHANNEIGVIHPIRELGTIAADVGALLHVDASQSTAWIPIAVRVEGIHLLSLSAHKMGGPKGVGVLYARGRNPAVRLAPLMHGGGHERGLRPGTLNVPGIVGLGAACEFCAESMVDDSARVAAMRDRLLNGLRASIDGLVINGALVPRLPNNLNVSFPGVPGEMLIPSLKGLSVSSGSACTSAQPHPSHVLAALGRAPELVHASLRFGLGRSTTPDEIETAIAIVNRAVADLQAQQ